MYGYIYLTRNLINDKMYIGQTTKLIEKHYLGSGHLLLKAIKKYGKENFSVEVLEYSESKEDLNEKEKEYIRMYRDKYGKEQIYNIADGGQGGYLGEEVSKKISVAVSGERNGFYGKTHTVEVRKIISETHSGENHRLFGKTQPDEVKKLISEKATIQMSDPAARKHLSEMKVLWHKNTSEEIKNEINEKRKQTLRKFHESPEGKIFRENHSKKFKGKNNPFYGKKHKQVKCPFCGKIGAEAPMKNQWHFDYCKLNPNRKLNQTERKQKC